MLKEFVTTLPVAVGLVPWPEETDRATVVVKMRLVANVHGELVPVSSGDAEPLSLDESDARGRLLYPSDFAPYKSQCDCFVVEEEADRAGGGHLVVGSLQQRRANGESAGPVATFLPGGDPTDVGAMAVWSAPLFDFGRFQSAPPGQRATSPRAPFGIRYMGSGARFFARFVGPEPRARLVDGKGGEVLVPLNLDTIAIRPRENAVTMIFRGVVTPNTWNELVAVDRGEGLDLASAARQLLVEPASLRAPRSQPAVPEPVSQQRNMRQTAYFRGGIPQAALPFLASAAGAPQENAPAITPREFAELRKPAAAQVRLAADPREQTMPVRLDQLLAGPPPEPLPAEPPRMVSLGTSGGMPLGFSPPATIGTSFAQERASSVPPAPPASPAEPPISSSSIARPGRPSASPPALAGPAPSPAASAEADLDAKLGRIQKDVWKGDRSLTEILANHGMTEMEWRAAKRASAARKR